MCAVRKDYLIVAAVTLLIPALALYMYSSSKVQEPGGWLFTIQIHENTTERFKVLVRDPAKANELRQLMKGEKIGHVNGELREGDGGFNKPWSWHLDPDTVEVVEVSIELCDGTPSFVERELSYWLNVVKRFCPWGARVVAEELWTGSYQP